MRTDGPSVKVMERAYVTDRVRHTKMTAAEAREEFRRGISLIELAAAEKALTEAADDLERANASPNLIELESRYAGFYSGIRSTTASNVEKLRTRAAAYRREETE